MKTIYTFLFLCVFFSSTLIHAQDVPSSVLPEVGDLVESIVGEPDNVDEGDSGDGQTWDFSNLVPMPLAEVSTTTYVDPSDTPHAAVFPSANLAVVTPTPSGDVYSYYRKENNKLEYLGGESLGTFIYFDENPQLVIDATLSGSDIIIDDFIGLTDIAMNPSFTTGIQDFVIEGTGTLILPSGTYNNAVRMVNTVERIDSSGNANFTIKTTTETTSYQWIIPGQVGPVMTISYTEGQSESVVMGGTPTITDIPMTKSVVYHPNPESGITATNELDQLEGISFDEVYPNPASDFIIIDLSSKKVQLVNFKLINLTGQVLRNENVLLSLGETQHQMDLSSYPNGTYLLSVSNEKGTTSRKIVKEN